MSEMLQKKLFPDLDLGGGKKRHTPSATPPAPGSVPGPAIHISRFAREPLEHYATPEWVTRALLSHVRFRGSVWEPCCGTGAISKVMESEGYNVVSTDIGDYGYGRAGVDFLTQTRMPKGCQALITNPPYGDATPKTHKATGDGGQKSAAALRGFVKHALDLARPAGGQVALLLRLQWIAGKNAAELLGSAPFSSTIILTRRIRWFEQGARTNTAQHHHCWIVFDYEQPPQTKPVLLYAG